MQLLSKYVSEQYLDNTSNNNRKLDAYLVNDVQLSYSFSVKTVKNITASLLINNVLDHKYEANGYTWGYMYGGFLYQQNNYYPQAGTNFLVGLSLKF